jgi:hypothetical protein
MNMICLILLSLLPTMTFAKSSTLKVSCDDGQVYTFRANHNPMIDRQNNWLYLDYNGEGHYQVYKNNLQNKVQCIQIWPNYPVPTPGRRAPHIKCENVYVPAQTYVSLGVPIAIAAHYECL